MCGVAAVIAPRLDRDSRGRIAEALTAAVAHRGPDHRAVAIEGAVALGHARLRVVDPRPIADQPMIAPGARLVFAGAIINHRELRAELERAHAVRFATTSDTEVLLHALRIFGEGALDRLKGMFAFVFHDVEKDLVLAARDRLGIKPLVWATRDDGGLVLASEAQAILAHGGVRREVDPYALRQILRFNHPLGDHTFFAGVHSLEPGTLLTCRASAPSPRIRRWWTPELEPRAMSLSSASDELGAAFVTAVRRAVDVDVPHGCYLSGGVDSSGIVAELAQTARAPRLYSLVFPGIEFSEERRIDAMADEVGLRPEKVAITGLTLADFVTYATRAEMPQWWTSDLALGKLAQRARADGTAVVLSGEGPDELFAGYEIYKVARVRPLLQRAGPLLGATRAALPVVRAFLPWLPSDTSVATAYVAGHTAEPERAIIDHFGFHPENLALWRLLDDRGPLLDAPADYLTHERAYFQRRKASDELSNLEKNLAFEIGERLPRWILHLGDRMSSGHGLELRFPYLDDDFVAASLRLPLSLRATFREDKRVLRHMHRRRLPRAVARRAKQPLYTPTGAWLGPLLADRGLERYWSRAVFARAGILDFDVCDAARARLANETHHRTALEGMTDEWLFTFALTASVVAVELLGA